MGQFFKDLISSQNETSSKRFAAIVSLFSLIIFAFLATFKNKEFITPEFMYYCLASIVAAGLGLTVVESLINKNNKNG
jgi:hypothetical protein